MARSFGLVALGIGVALAAGCSIDTLGTGPPGVDGDAGKAVSASGGAANASGGSPNSGGGPGSGGSPSTGGSPSSGGSAGAGDGAVCGDGKIEAGEECDDGNTTSGDGCSATCVMECAGGQIDPASHHCYWLHSGSDAASWSDGRSRCQSEGGHLVTINSAEENAFVRSTTGDVLWIGATDGHSESDKTPGTYHWITGEPWTFLNWAYGEPNAEGHSCGFLGFSTCYEHCASLDANGFWNDLLCDDTQSFACEREPAGS
jgi:cysteine-rich repeat protein